MPKLLDQPLPFAEALDRLRSKRILPTSLSSAELREEWPAALRQRALFSARTTKAAILQEYQDKLEELLNGETNIATARMEIQQLFDALNYTPEEGFPGDEGADIPPAERGSRRDLSSNGRVDLVLQTNMRQCANYGYWKQGQSDFALFAFPCYELVRIYPRAIPRGMRLRQGALEHVQGEDWPSRWEVAGGKFFGEGRMIARKDSEVWGRLGSSKLFPDALDTFFPPFAFNSGFGWREIDRATAIKLGVIGEETEIEGQHHTLNETLVAPGSLSVEMLDEALGDLEEYRAQLDQKIAAEKTGAAASQEGKAHVPWRFNFLGESVASNSSYDPNQLRGEGGRWAKIMMVPDVGDLVQGSSRPHPLDVDTPLATHDAGELMRRFPKHPTTVAFTRYFTKGGKAISDEQGKRIDCLLRRLPPMRTSEPLYRGVTRDTAESRDVMASSIRSDGFIRMRRWINSGSTSPRIAAAFAQAKGHGIILVAVKVDKSARDLRPLVQVLAPDNRHQLEITFLKGSQFRVVPNSEKSVQLPRSGKTPVFTVEELS